MAALLSRLAQSNCKTVSRLIGTSSVVSLGSTTAKLFSTVSVNSQRFLKPSSALRCGELSLALCATRVAPLLRQTQRRAASTTGDHVRLWQIERIISAVFIGLMPACIILENPIVDGVFATLLVMHAHWGLEAVILDYARPIVVGPIIPTVAFAGLYLLSAATLLGLLALTYNGPGIGTSVKLFWAIGQKPQEKA